MVTMLTSGESTLRMHEYSVEDFPEPVGPVTRMMPSGRLIISSKTLYMRGANPIFSSAMLFALGSRIRITIFSLTPRWRSMVGKELTRRSTSFWLWRMVNRPSRGLRFSAMSMLARTLMREMIWDISLAGICGFSMRSPSTR